MTNYEITPQDMMASAYNNWSRKPRNHIATTQAAIREHGKYLSDLESIERIDLRMAMDEYKAETDWSAFTKADWTAAYSLIK